MSKIGPFFYIDHRLICHAIPVSEGRRQTDKIDNPYGHERLYDTHFAAGDYIDYPRGRVIWDCTNDRTILYIDPCIRNRQVLGEVIKAFGIDRYVIEDDDHYHCRHCVGDLFF